jgi:hypothetical protein
MEARNLAGTTAITSTIYKYQLLFHSHTILLRIMALPDFDIDTITVDNLTALMSMQWESIVTEGCSSVRPTPLLTTASSSVFPSPARSPSGPSLLTDAERTCLTNAGGCWKCQKVPTDPGWIKHVGRTCPGNPTLGILLGRDFVEVKREIVGAMLNVDYLGEDQPDYSDDDRQVLYLDNETDSD